jgi:hypothetical protein
LPFIRQSPHYSGHEPEKACPALDAGVKRSSEKVMPNTNVPIQKRPLVVTAAGPKKGIFGLPTAKTRQSSSGAIGAVAFADHCRPWAGSPAQREISITVS